MEKIAMNLNDKKRLAKLRLTNNSLKDFEKNKAMVLTAFEIDEEMTEVDGVEKLSTVSRMILDGKAVSTVSEAVAKGLKEISEIFSESEIAEGEVAIEICSGRSNAGREFLYIELI